MNIKWKIIFFCECPTMSANYVRRRGLNMIYEVSITWNYPLFARIIRGPYVASKVTIYRIWYSDEQTKYNHVRSG